MEHFAQKPPSPSLSVTIIMRLSRLDFAVVSVLASWASAATVTYNSSALASDLPVALTLIRESNESCTVVSLAGTQKHRLLLHYEDVVVEGKLFRGVLSRQHLVSSLEQLKLIGYVPHNLLTKAQELCPDLTSRVARGEFSPMIHVDQRTFSATRPVNKLELELHPLVLSGPSKNRVDLTFFSDGYTIHEKDKFLADARRLALDMSQNQTFSTVQPLMNFWAAFSPSRETGIGVSGTPKDTAFGLYRDGTELRAVYCSKQDVARDACLSLHTQCDYPILLGNDPLYGGLGGEFTISTASELNGPLVLRHELGHSIIGVGEEYDGGFAYFGVNSAPNISHVPDFKWSHWLSSSLSTGEVPREERSTMSYQAYPWTILNKTSPWSGKFISSGLYSRYLVRFSLSGLPTAEHLKVYLDGEDLGWRPRPNIGLDRWHYDIYRSLPLTRGPHKLNFMLGESALEGTAQLCSVEIIEYGNENEFNSTNGYYGAFPTFSDQNLTTFRPTNEQCLMRVVTSTSFCSVCLEGLWLSLLKHVSLIDDFSVTLPVGDITHEEPVVLQLTLVPFGELRKPIKDVLTEFYTIVWEKDGAPLPQFANKTKIIVNESARGMWRVFVQLHPVEVKVDPNRLLESHAEVRIGSSWDSPSFVAPDAIL